VLLLPTSDGERLAAQVLPGGRDWVVLAHGFSGSLRKPALQRIACRLSAYGTVLAYDARGHGGSSGVSTLGDREVLDVDAAVRHAREAGARSVVSVGFSMGGSTVLRQAALGQPRPDAVVSVSAPSRWFVRDTVPMRRLHRVVETRTGRVFARGVMRTRISAVAWDPVPASPREVVGRIAPLPLLLVHGDRDAYFAKEHAVALHEAAGEPAELWLEPGFGHAEAAISADLVDRIGAHLSVLLGRRAAA